MHWIGYESQSHHPSSWENWSSYNFVWPCSERISSLISAELSAPYLGNIHTSPSGFTWFLSSSDINGFCARKQIIRESRSGSDFRVDKFCGVTFKPEPCVTSALLRFWGFVLPTKNQKFANHIYVMSSKNWPPGDRRLSSFARPFTEAEGPIVRAVIPKQV